LRELQKNGRITNAELADRVGLSPSACLRRVQDLEKQGVIKGYRVILDTKKLGIGFIAYVSVGLKTHSKEAQLAFELAMEDATEVLECHNVTGSFEYILRVETQDLYTYKKFHTDVLGDLPQVATISTHVVMQSSKDARR
jgi:DNA-binding Lrp family transcriptional regulator